ncbi:MAG: HNH endonuclease [Actinomycetaceae bacterium]|nr:HNH endonuclease [Actinomycetaceae bacterium]
MKHSPFSIHNPNKHHRFRKVKKFFSLNFIALFGILGLSACDIEVEVNPSETPSTSQSASTKEKNTGKATPSSSLSSTTTKAAESKKTTSKDKERIGAHQGTSSVIDNRKESKGTDYAWNGELINYKAEWDAYFTTLKSTKALDVLETLPVQASDSKSGYKREEFGNRWVDVDGNGCSTRNDILKRDLTSVTYTSKKTECIVKTGKLADTYTGLNISFNRDNASAVQIDHVVALSNAWTSGAQNISNNDRIALANDPYNLLAVQGSANMSKSDKDASKWLPQTSFKYEYVARQIAVKSRYHLWVTQAEKDAMKKILQEKPQTDVKQVKY